MRKSVSLILCILSIKRSAVSYHFLLFDSVPTVRLAEPRVTAQDFVNAANTFGFRFEVRVRVWVLLFGLTCVSSVKASPWRFLHAWFQHVVCSTAHWADFE